MPLSARTFLHPTRMQIFRYLLVGGVATGVHFIVLAFGLEVLRVPSAGLANAMAAVVGISVSFLGNRYFVFRAGASGFLGQMGKFGALYFVIAVMHGLILYLWSDLMGLDYRVGFLIATAAQLAMSFVGNKLFVFNQIEVRSGRSRP